MLKLNMKKNILITGCSSGLGFALTNYYLEKGFKVFGISRNSPNISNHNFIHKSYDLSNISQIKEELSAFKKEEAEKELAEAKKKSLPDIPKVNETQGVKTVNNTPTYNITVNNPADGFDIEAEMKKVEQKNKNKQLEDLD